MVKMRRLSLFPALAIVLCACPLRAQSIPASAPLEAIRYEVAFDRASARERMLYVTMSFDIVGAGDVLLSLPAWTPGAYELWNFSRNVTGFTARTSGRDLTWDKVGPHTWRVRPDGADAVEVRFRYLADNLDNAAAWTAGDGAFFNGTSVFLYPHGRGYDFPATVRIRTEPEWLVATGMRSAGEARTYGESSYHDLVDMPFLIGAIEVDSAWIEGKWHRLATYPSSALTGGPREHFWHDVRRLTPVMAEVWGGLPWDTYTTLIVWEPSFPGLSALEHQNSHLAIYNPEAAGSPVIAYVTAHEMVHAWNVKRLRPAELWPYDYERWQPTPLLWVSEGITEYYADLAMTRSGVGGPAYFLAELATKIGNVNAAPPVALEDASVSTWIEPREGPANIYYDKGALAGLMLDIAIRSATDNARSLDDAMRALYERFTGGGRGFTTEDFFAAASRAAGGRSFEDFHTRYIDGRERYPWEAILPLAGLRLVVDTTRFARFGVSSQPDSASMRVTVVAPGTLASDIGIMPGDLLERVGEVEPRDYDWGVQYRAAYDHREGESFTVRLRRAGEILTLNGVVRLDIAVTHRVEHDPDASPTAERIRAGLLGSGG
jgi:predicted metalloprotease with PDZ domain